MLEDVIDVIVTLFDSVVGWVSEDCWTHLMVDRNRSGGVLWNDDLAASCLE